jgi:serine/threonine protein kinase
VVRRLVSVGSILNSRYQIKKSIASGGMGEVWIGEDNVLSRIVAIKTVHPHYLSTNPEAIPVLHDEARAGASLLGHPNIVSVLDLGDHTEGDNSIHYIIMEYMDGITAHQWLKNKEQYDLKTYYNLTLFISLEMSKAIEYAHKKKVLHRDIKPLNTFVSKEGLIKVGDFGLARFIDAATRMHTVKGTQTDLYAAPEQWDGGKCDERTDIYQLGCSLYHILTGQPPFVGPMTVLYHAHLHQTPLAPKVINPLISAKVNDIIIKALEKKPSERAEMWEIKDIISAEIQSSYKIVIPGYNNLLPDVKKAIIHITDFGEDKNHKASVWSIPDYYEALSEGVQIALSGFRNFTVEKLD